MNRGLALFIGRLASNSQKDLFIVQLGVTLILGKFGLVGFPAKIIGGVLRACIGMLMEVGIFQIDIALDALKEGQKLKEFEKDATALYEKAISKVYSEEEKNDIRQQYLKIIARIGSVGNPNSV